MLSVRGKGTSDRIFNAPMWSVRDKGASDPIFILKNTPKINTPAHLNP